MKASYYWNKFQRRVLNDMEYFEKIQQRVWDHVTVKGPDDCWLWEGHRAEAGYGKMSTNNVSGPFCVHKIAWLLHNKRPLQSRRHIRHTCDNPPCCNPKHLVDGTARQNMRDAIRRGRFKYPPVARGAMGTQAKLSHASARFIADNFIPFSKGEFGRKALAKRFHVSGMSIYRIARSKTWAHLGGCKNPRSNRLPKELEEEFKRRHEPGARRGPNTTSALAKEFGLPYWAASDIVTGRHR